MKLHLLVLLAVFACSQQCNGSRILGIFPLNGKSHWVMAERLMLGLAERGHQVDVVTHFLVKKPPPNYREISLDGTREPAVNNINASFVERFSNLDVNMLVQMGGNLSCELMEFPQFQDLIKSRPKYDVIIVEIFLAPCFLAFGRYLNAPMVGMMTSGFHEWLSHQTGNPHNPSFLPGLFTPFDQRMTFSERLTNTIVTNLFALKLNYQLAKQVDYVKRFFDMDATIEDLYKDVGAVLINSHHSVNGIRPMSTGSIEVGGLHINENADPLSPEVQKWLDESKDGCIFFTFGSMVRVETFPAPLLQTFYKVFEKIAPVRVLMKVAKKEALLPGLPKNVMTQPWFPQVSVFKHRNVKAFITHGGLMSTLEAIYFTVPMIGIPLFGDQGTNLKNVANKRIAVNLGSISNVTEETLGAAINAILYDNTYRTNMKKLSELFKDRPMSPLDTAIYWVEYVGRHGNILQSPAVHLAWYQYALLDVYGLLLACLGVILYVAVFVLRKAATWLLGGKSRCKTENKQAESKKKK